MKKLLLATFVFSAIALGQVSITPQAHATTTTTPSLSSLQEIIKSLQAKIAELTAQVSKVRGDIKIGKKDSRHDSDDDGTDVEVEVEHGTVTLSFVVGSTTHNVSVSTTTESKVLEAVATKLGVSVTALDATLVADIKAELARKLLKKEDKVKNKDWKKRLKDEAKLFKKADGRSKDVTRHIEKAQREIDEAKADGVTDTELAPAVKLLADAKVALAAKDYKKAKELAKDAKDAAKDLDDSNDSDDSNDNN